MTFLRTMAMLRFWVGALLLCALSACGSSEPETQEGESIRIYLAREGVSTNRNTLHFDLSNRDEYLVRLSGEGFDSELEFGEAYPVPKTVNFAFEEYGSYAVTVDLLFADGALLSSEEYAWEYQDTVPDPPIVGFVERATNDQLVELAVSPARGEYTNEIMITGDLEDETQSGVWLEIDATDVVQLRTTSDDGWKNFTVKLRNKWGVESEEKSLRILKKSRGPQSCSFELASSSTGDGTARLRVMSDDKATNYVRVIGDVEKITSWRDFIGATVLDLRLNRGFNAKNLTIQVRDVAENYCEPMQAQVTAVEGYEPFGAGFANYWVNSETVDLELAFDRLSTDAVKVYVDGSVADGENTRKWVAMRDSLPITLLPGDGNRIVRVRFRGPDGEETEELITKVYLRPQLYIQGTNTTRVVVPANIVGTETLTIDGCEETYESVEFASSFACTPTGSMISATYRFVNGDGLTLEAAL